MPEDMEIPITIPTIQTHQIDDVELNLKCQQDPQHFPAKYIGDRQTPLICYCSGDEPEKLWRIAILAILVQPII